MKFNYSKLLGRFREYGFTQKDIAERIGISHVTLSLKLNGKAQFHADEIAAICRLLDIPGADIGIYFFAA